MPRKGCSPCERNFKKFCRILNGTTTCGRLGKQFLEDKISGAEFMRRLTKRHGLEKVKEAMQAV